MPKRKRGQSDSADPTDSSRIQQRLFHGRRVLQRALKTAKAFERQKLARRARSAEQNESPAESRRIEAETESLKTLNLSDAAQSHLQKCMVKDKQLNSVQELQTFCDTKAQLPKDPATSNVLARLYNSKVAKENVADILDRLRVALGFEQRSLNKAQKQTERSNQKAIEYPDEEHSDSVRAEKRQYKSPQAVGKDSFEGFEDRVAASDGSPAREREMIPGALPNRHPRPMRRSPSYSSYSGPDSPITPPEDFYDQPRAAPGLGNAAFIPALTMGGYWSGSESGQDDREVEEMNLGPRRNRRGQRARQKIWEMKFGRGARHLQGQGGQTDGNTRQRPGVRETGDRDAGWNLQKGAQEESSKKSKYKPGWARARAKDSRESGGIKFPGPAGKSSQNAGNQNFSKDNGPLHPSWEAARRSGEQKNVGIGSFTGNKMVFD